MEVARRARWFAAVWGCIGRSSGMLGVCVRSMECVGLLWLLWDGRKRHRRWVPVDSGNYGEAWWPSRRLGRAVKSLGEGRGARESFWIARARSGLSGIVTGVNGFNGE